MTDDSKAQSYEGESCPLCESVQTFMAHQAAKSKARVSARPFLHCQHCDLIFVPKAERLSPSEERGQYELHENNPYDPHYRKFLSRLAEPLLAMLTPNRFGLDFGCGPGPTLSKMLAEHGHRIRCYDPFFYPEPAVFPNTYDFITATEVIEHLSEPGKELRRLQCALRADSDGILALMTKRWTTIEAFSTWHYWKDPTHICFFHKNSFHYLANRLSMEVEFVSNDVVFLHNHRISSR